MTFFVLVNQTFNTATTCRVVIQRTYKRSTVIWTNKVLEDPIDSVGVVNDRRGESRYEDVASPLVVQSLQVESEIDEISGDKTPVVLASNGGTRRDGKEVPNSRQTLQFVVALVGK